MKSFEDWYFDLFESGNGICLNQQEIAEEAYLLGQQSKQAEIDELRKRMDDIAKRLNNIKNDTLRDHRYDYDKGWRDCAITVLNDLLKG